VLNVARQTLSTRQVVLDQVSALASNKLKSDLDVSFARVNVEESRLLVARAESDLDAAFTELSTLLGERTPRRYELVDEPLPAEMSDDPAPLVATSLGERPRLIRLRAEAAAAAAQARADRAAHYPTVSAVGGVGIMPVRDRRLDYSYAAGGVVVNLPLFTGGRDLAKQRESELKALAAAELLRDEENNVVRDVRVAFLKARHAQERLALTAKLFDHARSSHDLARARYNLGASSIAELSQAQLNLTSAEIARTSARYEYLALRAELDFQAGTLK
jgi:outer membrane protein